MNSLLDASAPDMEAAGLRILHSDTPGTLLPLFLELLWRRQGRDVAAAASGKHAAAVEHALEPGAVTVADAVVIQRGRPIQWYFTSVKEKGVLLAKLRKNVTAESIVDHFLQRKHLSVSGVCAQFVEQCDAHRQGVRSTFVAAADLQVWLSTLPATRSGLLHRFVDPALAPGSACNWEISAMWTPAALDAERVESNKELGDASVPSDLRCDVYRPEVSVTRRLVCTRQMAMVDRCCRAIAEHAAAITGGRTRISAMELQFKVGPNDALILLYPRRIAYSSNDGGAVMELALPCALPVKLPMETMNSVALSGPPALPRHRSNIPLPGSRATPTPTPARSGAAAASPIDLHNVAEWTAASLRRSASRGAAGGAAGSERRAGSIASSDAGSTSTAGGGVRGGGGGATETCCIVCKRRPVAAAAANVASSSKATASSSMSAAKTSRALMLVPLKHILLSLEILEEEKRKAVASAVGSRHSQPQAHQSVTMSSALLMLAEQRQRQSNPDAIPLHVSMLFPELTEREYAARRRVWGDDKVPICGQCSAGLADSLK